MKLRKAKNSIIIENSFIRVGFENSEQGLFLSELAMPRENSSSFLDFIRRPTLLWEIELLSKKGDTTSISMAGTEPEIAETEGNIIFVWPKAIIATTETFAKVIVTLAFNHLQQLEWRLSVTNLPSEWSVLRAHFPRMDLAVDASDDYRIVLPVDHGVSYPNPLKNMPAGGIHEKLRRRPYPHGGFTMQLVALQNRENMLYFAAHDPAPMLKTFYVGADPENSLIYVDPYVHTLIEYGKDYDQPFPWVTASLKGDWYDAAQIYRQFALTASWTKRGAIEKGGKTPLWYQKTPMVLLRNLRGPCYEADDIIAEKDYIGLPLVTHYYKWSQVEWDEGNPFYFPSVPGFRQTIAKLKEHSVFVMPYVDTFEADTWLPEWEQGLKASACVVNERGDLDLHVWGKNPWALMCPSAPLWRRLINDYTMRMFEMGLRAIYVDEIAASASFPCYATTHNHIPGGGSTFIDAQNSFLKEIRDEATEFNSEIVITTEGCAEPYMLYTDSFLIGNSNDPYEVPLFEAVYHDYTMGFGRYTFTPDLTDPAFTGAIISKHAQQFVCGLQFGWSRVPFAAIIQKHPVSAAFLRHLAHVWVNNFAYLASGRMLRPLDFSDQLEPIICRWARSWDDTTGTEVRLMPILNSVWQIDDGSIGVVLVNITEKPVKLDVKLAGKQEFYLGIAREGSKEEVQKAFNDARYYPLPQNAVGQVRFQDGDKQIRAICDGDSEGGFSVEVPALNCVVIAIGSEKRYGVHDY